MTRHFMVVRIKQFLDVRSSLDPPVSPEVIVSLTSLFKIARLTTLIGSPRTLSDPRDSCPGASGKTL